ncbi:MAG: glycoside hydrolase family 127 protein [Lachnospiraceae bacterium]|nr:glycoside hydrolase family 127 protein [Lachnospiraceae bacterium]
MKGLKSFGLSEVKLQDSYFKNAYEKEVLYLTSFHTDRLLAGFRETAGVDMRDAVRYPGWENMLIGGHTLGHYMTACVKCYESANCSQEDRRALLKKVKKLLVGLKECQDALGTGFLFGAVIADPSNIELQFDHVEAGRTNIITEAWVPWYTMHKIFEGLVSAANMDVEKLLSSSPLGVDKMEVEYVALLAKDIASRLADWTYGRTSSWSEKTHKTVLSIEYGGMNDCLYDVYLLTGKKTHLEAAHAFDQVELFDRIFRGKMGDHVLNNHHANTTIPKFMGALKRFVVTGEQDYFDYAADFWEKVVNYHSYATGGNSEWEHFGLDNVLDKERTNCNCETCNAYNMLKMTKQLFMITGDGKYADWYENTFLNSIMSSQNPETGMTTYFQPMASGFFKVYGEPFTKFWCCTGSGMENFSKLQESFYFYKEDALIVNQYISSTVTFRGYQVDMESFIPNSDTVILKLINGYHGKLLLRIPSWLAQDAKLTVNGSLQDYEVVGKTENAKGYVLLEGSFEENTVVELQLPMQVQAHSLPDGQNTYCFKYGPVLLSALLGTWNMEKGVTGVDVTIPKEAFFGAEYLSSRSEKVKINEGSVQDYMANIGLHMEKRSDKPLAFKLRGTNANLVFVTHYRQHKERYGIYFQFEDSTCQISQKEKEYQKIDTVQPGYGQYESDSLHQMKEMGNGSVGITNDGTRRYAKAGGSFSYTMLVNPEGTALLVTLRNQDLGKTLRICVEDVVVFETGLDESIVSKESLREEGYFDLLIPLEKQILSMAQMVTVDGQNKPALRFTFSAALDPNGETKESASVCQFLYTVENN